MLVIDTKSESELQLFGEAECRLMEDGGIEYRSVEVATHQYLAVGKFHTHRHCHSHHRDLWHVAVDAAFEEAHAVAHEGHWSLGVEALVHEVDTRNPVPAVVTLALHCQLVAEGAQLLLLLESVDVEMNEVLIHEHTVAESLETSHVADGVAVGIILCVQAHVDHTSLVRALTVGDDISHLAKWVGIQAIADSTFIIIRICALVVEVVVDVEVELQARRWQVERTESSASRLQVIYLLASLIVGEESFG